MSAVSSIFQPSSADLSVSIFNYIFGVGWQDLFTSHGVTASAGVLASMFHILNTVVLSGITLFFIYVMTTGVIGSSYEGNVGGRRLHNFYVPVRGLIGVSLLSPLPWLKGFCLIQALILMFIGFGIGAADTLWSSVVSYQDLHPGNLAVSMDQSEWPLAENIFQSLVLNDYLQIQEGMKPTRLGIHWIKYTDLMSCTHISKVSMADCNASRIARNYGKEFNIGKQAKTVNAKYARTLVFAIKGLPISTLGTVTVGCGAILSECVPRMEAVNKMVADLAGAAQHYAQLGAAVNATPLPSINAVSKAVSDYNNIIGTNISANIMSKAKSQLASDLSKFTQQAKAQGWLASAMWFWHVANIQQAVAARVYNQPYYAPMERKALKAVTNSNISGMMRAAALYAFDGRQLMNQSASDVHGSGVMGDVDNFINSHFGLPLLSGYVGALKSSNPIAALQAWGNGVMDAADSIMGAYLTISAANKMEKDIPGIGKLVALFSGSAIVKSIGIIVWIISLSLLGIGAAYAIFLPAVPFMLMTFAYIGFCLIAIETVVAGPFWAAAHPMPEGEGMAGVHGRQGYMLFLTVLFRPVLLIIGYFVAFRLYSGVSWFIAESFGVYIKNMEHNYLIGVFSLIFILMLSLTVTTGSTLMIWRLMTHLGENVMRWLGQLAQSMNENTQADRTHRSAVVAAGALPRGVEKAQQKIANVQPGPGAATEGLGASVTSTEPAGGNSPRGTNEAGGDGGGGGVGPAGGGGVGPAGGGGVGPTGVEAQAEMLMKNFNEQDSATLPSPPPPDGG